MLLWQKDNLISIEKAKNISQEELNEKIIIGEFVNIDKEKYIEKREKLISKAK